MRCDNCPLFPDYPGDGETTCEIAEGDYGLVHKDGMRGCRNSWSWCKKRAEVERTEMLRLMILWADSHSKSFNRGENNE